MPTILFYNPWNEMAIADGGKGFLPNKTIKTMEEDLAPLLWVFAEASDIVLVDKKPDSKWLDKMRHCFTSFPTFQTLEETLEQIRKKEFIIDAVEPWGWSPRLLKILEPLVPHVPKQAMNSPNFRWDDSYKDFYGRKTALLVLNHFLNHSTLNRSLFIPNKQIPEIVYNINEIPQLLSRWGKIIIKAPHSSSGRGILPITQPKMNQNILQRIQQSINQSGYVMCEPYFEVVAQISIQFRIDSASCQPISIQAFETTSKGTYLGNYVGKAPITYQANQFLSKINWIDLSHSLATAIQKVNSSDFYRGHFGIDTLLYKTSDNDFKLNPCSEINLRKNMGLVAQQLAKHIPVNLFGFLRIINRNNPDHANYFHELEKSGTHTTFHLNQPGLFPVTPYKYNSFCLVVEIQPFNTTKPMFDLPNLTSQTI